MFCCSRICEARSAKEIIVPLQSTRINNCWKIGFRNNLNNKRNFCVGRMRYGFCHRAGEVLENTF